MVLRKKKERRTLFENVINKNLCIEMSYVSSSSVPQLSCCKRKLRKKKRIFR